MRERGSEDRVFIGVCSTFSYMYDLLCFIINSNFIGKVQTGQVKCSVSRAEWQIGDSAPDQSSFP